MIFAAGGVPILETHRLHEKDGSPLVMVSAERLAYYLRIEAELAEMRATFSACLPPDAA